MYLLFISFGVLVCFNINAKFETCADNTLDLSMT